MKGLEFKYKLVGQGDSKNIEKVISELGLEENVEIIGSLNHSEIFLFFKEIDVYIQPSLTEGLPRAVIEAMSCALPIIGTRVGGIPELVSEKCLYDGNELHQLASILVTLSIAEMKEMAIENFLKSKEFDFHFLKDKREAFYDVFLEDHGLK
jgi:glycosyltransferase involved in cell wall biosynthesis